MHIIGITRSFVADLFSGLKEANQSVKEVIQLGRMYDVKSWIDPVLEKLHNHSNPHIFKFLLDSDGNARMLYKKWCKEQEWLPKDSPGILLVKVCPSFTPCQHF